MVDICHCLFCRSIIQPSPPIRPLSFLLENPPWMVLGGKSLINACSHQERDSGGNDPRKQGHGTDHRGGRVLTRLSRGYPQLLSLPWFQSIFQV